MQKIKSAIPNLLTAGNLIGGVMAIIFSLTGKLEWAPYCIFISAFLDFFDGFAARLLKVQSELGKQLDSLADMVTFGVAPGVIVYQLIKLGFVHNGFNGISNASWMNGISYIEPDFYILLHRDYLPSTWTNQVGFSWLPYIALLIPVMSMFRLAKFNLDTRQSNSFIGVPTPANTLFFASFPLILLSTSQDPNDIFSTWVYTLLLNPWFYAIAVPIMSFLLIAELPLFALKFKSFGWKGNEIRYIFLTIAVALLATLHWLALPIIIILYILLSLIQNLRRNEIQS